MSHATHLAGFERKRSRSLLLMDHGCLGICLRLEKMFAMLQQPAARSMHGEYWCNMHDVERKNFNEIINFCAVS